MITPQEAQVMQERIDAAKRRRNPQPAPVDAVEKESDLHDQIAQYVKLNGWIGFHGSMAHSTFRTPGEPDWTILADNSRVFFFECKTRTGKLTPEQQGIISWAAKLGHTVHVIRSFTEFLNIVKPL